jgi:hypothetical protein
LVWEHRIAIGFSAVLGPLFLWLFWGAVSIPQATDVHPQSSRESSALFVAGAR